jgi:CheY-like chemotaxis protein
LRAVHADGAAHLADGRGRLVGVRPDGEDRDARRVEAGSEPPQRLGDHPARQQLARHGRVRRGRVRGQHPGDEVGPVARRDHQVPVRAERPDLVLSDVMMPGMDGFALLAALRADPATATTPVIMLSARAGEEATIEGLAAGADDYLVKPFSSHDLLARVRSNLELAQLRNREGAWRAALVNALQDPFFVVDAAGRVVEVNEAVGEVLGYGPAGVPYNLPHPWWPDAAAEPDEHAQLLRAQEAAAPGGGRFLVPVRHRAPAAGRGIRVAAARSGRRRLDDRRGAARRHRGAPRRPARPPAGRHRRAADPPGGTGGPAPAVHRARRADARRPRGDLPGGSGRRAAARPHAATVRRSTDSSVGRAGSRWCSGPGSGSRRWRGRVRCSV